MTTPDLHDGPVRVVAIVDRYPPWVNAGAEWMLHAMLRHLVQQGHRVDVVTDVRSPGMHEGVTVIPRNAASAEPLIAAADVLVGHLLWTREVVEAADRHGKPLLYVLHNDAQLRHWQLAPRNVTVTVANSLWLLTATQQQGWGGPTSVVRPPVLLSDYHLDRDPAGCELVTLVNPTPEKGAGTFYAVAKVERGRRFATVGGGYGQQLRAPRGVDNVEPLPATGTIRDDVYARTRVLMVPSRYESWGRVAVEAMCSGIPVIAHPTPGLVEALGGAGTFIDRADHAEWVRILRMLDDPGVYAALSAMARRRAEYLDGQSRRDLARWERLVRTAATAGPKVDGMAPTYKDSFATVGKARRPKARPAPPPEPVANTFHQVRVDLAAFPWTDDGNVTIALDDAPGREWLDQDPIGRGDRVRLIEESDPDRWIEGEVVEVATLSDGEQVVVRITGDSDMAAAARARLAGVRDSTGQTFAEHVFEDMERHPIPDSLLPQDDPTPSAPVEPDGGPETALQATVTVNGEAVPGTLEYTLDSVPGDADAVVAWIYDATSTEDQQARCAAAWDVERHRPGRPRTKVANVARPLNHTPPSE